MGCGSSDLHHPTTAEERRWAEAGLEHHSVIDRPVPPLGLWTPVGPDADGRKASSASHPVPRHAHTQPQSLPPTRAHSHVRRRSVAPLAARGKNAARPVLSNPLLECLKHTGSDPTQSQAVLPPQQPQQLLLSQRHFTESLSIRSGHVASGPPSPVRFDIPPDLAASHLTQHLQKPQHRPPCHGTSSSRTPGSGPVRSLFVSSMPALDHAVSPASGLSLSENAASPVALIGSVGV